VAVVMVVVCVTTFWRALTRDEPLVDLAAFGNMNFALSSLFSFLMGTGLYGLTYLYPLYLASIRGYDSLIIGETVFISGMAMFFSAPLAGVLSRKLDPRIMMLLGIAGFATLT
jgi:DHA2 family multidrug resistance protein